MVLFFPFLFFFFRWLSFFPARYCNIVVATFKQTQWGLKSGIVLPDLSLHDPLHYEKSKWVNVRFLCLRGINFVGCLYNTVLWPLRFLSVKLSGHRTWKWWRRYGIVATHYPYITLYTRDNNTWVCKYELAYSMNWMMWNLPVAISPSSKECVECKSHFNTGFTKTQNACMRGIYDTRASFTYCSCCCVIHARTHFRTVFYGRPESLVAYLPGVETEDYSGCRTSLPISW